MNINSSVKAYSFSCYSFNLLISFIILYCNSESLSDASNSKEKNQSDKSISEISTTLFVDTENSMINWTGKKLASSHEGTLNILSGEILL